MSNKKLNISHVEIAKLKPWDKNPRINDHAINAVAKSIREFGFNVPILCNDKFQIIAGHTRWKAAKKLNMSVIPVIILDLSTCKSIAFSIADNRLSEIAFWKYDELKKILKTLEEDVDLSSLGFSEMDLRKFFNDYNEDVIPSFDNSSDTEIRSGHVHKLGDGVHTLLCGDSCLKNSFEKVVKPKTVAMCYAGPPCYNQRNLGNWKSVTEFNDDMHKAIHNIVNSLKEGGICVWHVGNDSVNHCDFMGKHSSYLQEAGLKYLDTIIWAKSTPNYGSKRSRHIRSSSHYYPAFQWEGLLIYQKEGLMPKMSREAVLYMTEHHTNLWKIPTVNNQMKILGHPASCPVELVYRCLQAYSVPGDLILDPFAGSGTTLIAAEKAGRKSVCIEKSPKFCDGIVRRWNKIQHIQEK